MTLRCSIIDAVDTGAGMESIIEDVLEWTEYTQSQVVAEVNKMLDLGFMEDRGQYFVFLWRDKKANEYVKGLGNE